MMKPLGTAVAPALFLSLPALAQNAGGESDVSFAALLWGQIVKFGQAGEGTVMAFTCEGVDPHGKMLETFHSTATVDGNTGALVIKRNYGPEVVGIDEVLGDPAGHLGALTVMFAREAGYDDEN